MGRPRRAEVKQRSLQDERFEEACFLCEEKRDKFFKCPMRELADKFRKESQVRKALNHTRSLDSREKQELPVIETPVRLGPETRIVSC